MQNDDVTLWNSVASVGPNGCTIHLYDSTAELLFYSKMAISMDFISSVKQMNSITRKSTSLSNTAKIHTKQQKTKNILNIYYAQVTLAYNQHLLGGIFNFSICVYLPAYFKQY